MLRLSNTTKNKLQKLGVGIVYLFGSQAQKTATRQSDIDIGIVFVDPKKSVRHRLKLYTTIHTMVEGGAFTNMDGSRLDISFLQQANPALAMAAMQYGVVLFEQSPIFRANFEEQALKLYVYYLPLKYAYEKANFAAFA